MLTSTNRLAIAAEVGTATRVATRGVLLIPRDVPRHGRFCWRILLDLLHDSVLDPKDLGVDSERHSGVGDGGAG